MPTTKASYGEKKTHTTKDGKKAKKGLYYYINKKKRLVLRRVKLNQLFLSQLMTT